jgi:hypothetical protein
MKSERVSLRCETKSRGKETSPKRGAEEKNVKPRAQNPDANIHSPLARANIASKTTLLAMKRFLRASIHSSDWLFIKENSRAARFPSLCNTFFPHREKKDARTQKRNLRSRERASALLSPVSRDARNLAYDSAPHSRVYALLSTREHLIHVPFFTFF